MHRQIYLHNHKTTKTIYESYKRGISLPLTAEVRKDLGYMVEVQTRSLVVTSATGRGIPVVDLLALDQKGGTMERILEFFKRHNPSWTSIETISINKDFVEWRVLERVFSGAKVLLCQFHAISHWWKVCRRQKYNQTMSQRERMEHAFGKLIYWYERIECSMLLAIFCLMLFYNILLLTVLPFLLLCMSFTNSNTERTFNSELVSFTKVCEKECPALLEYFTANWKECDSMWANFIRGNGNSVLGRNTYMCNDYEWTCTCLCYCSLHLPCQYLMYVADRVHQFEYLPESTVPQRWDMVAMSELEKELQDGVGALQTVQESMKEARNSWTHNGLTQNEVFHDESEATQGATETTQSATQPAPQHNYDVEVTENIGRRRRKQLGVIYVKMRRQERANVVVLSSEEKYCYAKAVFEPVMEHLASLATPAFVAALKSWKNIVRSGLKTVEAASTTSPDESEESDDPDTSDTSPVDLIDSMNFTQELEQDKAGSNDTGVDSKQESAADKNEAILAATPTPSKAASGTMSASMSKAPSSASN
ncbi:unnamed protein product [Phytophthora fragariaefolia]|uniref:Unnamed protein product n=1 Tax=Phytophthora fragariaefolia TaxID=1490495 RepID=A0A9W6U175_9STRA|nr:unnamed protein product [Phytophthora fragariaefolia]